MIQKCGLLCICFSLLVLGIVQADDSDTPSHALFWYMTHPADEFQIHAFDTVSQEIHLIATIPLNEYVAFWSQVAALSPDGRWLAYVVAGGRFNTHIVDLQTGENRTIASNHITRSDILIGGLPPTIEWSPNGDYLLIRAFEGFFRYDLGMNTLHQIAENDRLERIGWMRDSTLWSLGPFCTLGVGCVTALTMFDADTLIPVSVYSAGNISNGAAYAMCDNEFSLDGRYLAYMANCVGTEGPDIERDVYIYDTQRDAYGRVTTYTVGTSLEALHGAEYELIWADEDTLLIGASYTNATGDHTETLTYNVTENILTSVFPLYGQDWTFSPDRNYLAYRVADNYQYDLASYSVRVSTPQDLNTFLGSAGIACNFMWSPDSVWLAYSIHQTPSFNMCDYPVEEMQFMDVRSGQVLAPILTNEDEIVPLGWVASP